MIYSARLSSPVGPLLVRADKAFLLDISFARKRSVNSPRPPPHLRECLRQLEEYFQGKRKEFNLDLRPRGTDFQKKVWKALLEVGFGETASYLDVARKIGSPKAMRAVGGANHANPFSIVIPCHRIIGSRGGLVGYGGGLDKKTWLLQHESKVKAG